MNRKTLRAVILVTGLITATIHLVVLNLLLGKVDLLFTLNGFGYLGLLAAFFFDLPLMSERRQLVNIAFIAFAGVTIVAWFILGDRTDLLGIATKIDEAVLIAALVGYMRSPS
jgi:hypothetical protein